MKNRSATITVGMPVYNMSMSVGRAIESVLSQTTSDWILLISDNASTDGTFEVCKKYEEMDSRIRVERNARNIGASKNFQRLLAKAKTRFYASLAADDLFAPSYLEKCHAKLVSTSGAVHCCSQLYFIDDSYQVIGKHSNFETSGLSLSDKISMLLGTVGWFATYGVAYTDILRMLPVRTCHGPDVLNLLELLLLGDIVRVDEPLFYYNLVIDKPASQYALTLKGKMNGVSNKPFTDMARNLFYILQYTGLPSSIRDTSQNELIKTLALANNDYLMRVFRETPACPKTRLQSPALRQGFISSLVRGRTNDCRSALVFFPHNLWPPKSGAHARALTMIKSLISQGYQVVLFSTTLFTDVPWSEASVKGLNDELGVHVEIYQCSDQDRKYLLELGPSQFWERYLPPGLTLQFRQVFLALKPDVVLVNYSLWGDLCSHNDFADSHLIIDSLDLFTRNMLMSRKLSTLAIRYDDSTYDYEISALREDFFDDTIDAIPSELEKFDLYHTTLAISEWETEYIRANTKRTTTEFLPVSCTPAYNDNTYSEFPVFVAGPNSFNVQGYYFLCRRVLPIVREVFPDFLVRVVGSGTRVMRPERGVILQGFVEDLGELYTKSEFAVCPLLGGTGQQIKVVEAMAHGLPVIILNTMARSSPLRHEINGLVAKTADEFANCIIRLHGDKTLCHKLGQQARETIVKNYSDASFSDQLSKILSRQPSDIKLRN